MIYGSVCSGIEAATVAWKPLGWQAQFFSEIEKFPCAVLNHHYPTVPNLGDMTKFKEWPDATIDVLVGGTPCQSFSVAGLRKGLDDPRGNLMLTYLAITDRYRPRWVVWENVPGVLSSTSHDAPDPCPPPPPVDMECDGQEMGTEDEYDSEEIHAFNSFLAGLSELGYGAAYRILDAQYFGVPQRRRRVFVIGYLGDWRPAAAVLFERHSLQGHSAPRHKAHEDVAGTIEASLGRSRGAGQSVAALTATGVGTCGPDDNQGQAGHIIPALTSKPYADRGDGDLEKIISMSTGQASAEIGIGIGTTLNCNHEAPIVAGGSQPVAFSCKDDGRDCTIDQSPTLRSMNSSGSHANGGGQVAVALNIRGREGGGTIEVSGEIATALRASSGGGDKLHCLVDTMVRRLTPRECERLQAFKDNYTLIPNYRIKLKQSEIEEMAIYLGISLSEAKEIGATPDGPRYKALGNSMHTGTMKWIGERIELVDNIITNIKLKE